MTQQYLDLGKSRLGSDETIVGVKLSLLSNLVARPLVYFSPGSAPDACIGQGSPHGQSVMYSLSAQLHRHPLPRL
jgi:hypothetical protein|uniref:Uncharacterized protein n=1 Tax=Zea mays TaxID=4577 RepID=B4FE19_MAIZE|nr:unknown [Zea mays]